MMSSILRRNSESMIDHLNSLERQRISRPDDDGYVFKNSFIVYSS